MSWQHILMLVGALFALVSLAPFSRTYRRCKYQRGYLEQHPSYFLNSRRDYAE